MVQHHAAHVPLHRSGTRHVAQHALGVLAQQARRAVHPVDHHAADADDVEIAHEPSPPTGATLDHGSPTASSDRLHTPAKAAS